MLALGEIKPVEDAFQPFALEFRANVVSRQSRPQRERMRVHPAATTELTVHGGDVKGLAALVLKLDVLDERLVARDQLGDGVREIGRVHRPDIAFDDGQLALVFRDDQVARVARGPGFFGRRDKYQLNRLDHDHAGRRVNEGAVEEKCRVERRKRAVFHAHVTPQVPFEQRRIGSHRCGQAASLHAVGQRRNG